MLTLWLDSNQFVLDEIGCQEILTNLPRANEFMFFQSIDGTSAKHTQRKYKSPGFKFVCKSKSYAVPKRELAKLQAACEQGLNGKAEFQVGFRAISSTAGKITVMRFDPESGKMCLEDQ